MRQLSAIMFTDIAGYSALMQKDEIEAVALRKEHRKIFELYHEKYRGRIVQYYGDGTLSTFPSVIHAVECAIEMQNKWLIEGKHVPVKIAIHLGDIIHTDTEVYGDGVNVTARIESIASSGSILISEKVREEIKNQTHIAYQFLGSYDFKNIAKPVDVFAISNEGLSIPDTTEISKKVGPPEKSIAVLPFANMSPDPSNEYICDGLTEEIINAFTKIKELKVSSRTSSFRFKDSKQSISEIGASLNVSTILEGSVRIHHDNIRITAQLIDVKNDQHFWSEVFDRKLDNLFAVQDEVSLKIANRLREHIGHLNISDHLVRKQDISIDLYKSYLKGRYHILKMNPEGINKGMSILTEVLDQKPDYSFANLGMHLAYTLKGTLGLMPSMEAFEKSGSYLKNAIQQDPDLPECQLQLAWISFLKDWDLEQTYKHLEKVGQEIPFVDYYQTMASVLVVERRFRAAHKHINTAIQLDPFSDINQHLKGYIFYVQEKYEDAIRHYQKSIDLKPDAEVSYLEYGQTLILTGNPEKALELFERLPAGDNMLLRLGGITLSLASMGHIDLVSQNILILEEKLEGPQSERAIQMLILIAAALKDYEGSIAYLKKAFEFRFPLLMYLANDPFLKDLHEYEAYKKLVSQLNIGHLQEKAEHHNDDDSLVSDQLIAKREALISFMKDEQSYKDQDISLPKLAASLEMHPNELSQLLNEGFDKNFSEFINEYRIQDFKDRVAKGEHISHTILSMAFASGFNSKTVFNTFFKKSTGLTPKQYIQSISKN